jgi:hypothetical protein
MKQDKKPPNGAFRAKKLYIMWCVKLSAISLFKHGDESHEFDVLVTDTGRIDMALPNKSTS